MMREWIILALCLGVGGPSRSVSSCMPRVFGHGVRLDSIGLLSGLAVYGLVQVGRGVRNFLARSQVPVEERTQRLMVNRRASRGWTLGIDPCRLICVELLYARSPA